MEDLFELLGQEVDDELRPVLDAFLAELEQRADIACRVIPGDPSELLDPELLGADDLPGFGFGADAALRVPGGELTALEAAFAHAEQALLESNRAAAAHADAIRRALQLAGRHPELFLPEAACADRDAAEFARRAAATELSMRVKVPATTLRSRAHEAAVLQERLPEVWRRYADGVAGPAEARLAARAANAFDAGDARLEELDRALAAAVGTMTQTRFQQRVGQVTARLDRAALTARHVRAHADRRVVIEHVDDGMSWVSLHVSQLDAARIDARLDATARAMHGHSAGGDAACGAAHGAPDPRTLAQLRADAAVDWLTGAGTATAVRTEVIVTIPLLGLAGSNGRSGVARSGEGAPDIPASDIADEADVLAHLEGVGPIDPGTAARLFADAPSFLRLVTDPVTGVPLKLGRRRYRPTRKQRLWLALRYERCTRPGCDRLASRSDVDHLVDWHRGGSTDDTNLGPACRSDHVIRHRTGFTVTRSRRGSMIWRSPTGYAATTAPGGRDPADDPEFGRPRSPFEARPPVEYTYDPAF